MEGNTDNKMHIWAGADAPTEFISKLAELIYKDSGIQVSRSRLTDYVHLVIHAPPSLYTEAETIAVLSEQYYTCDSTNGWSLFFTMPDWFNCIHDYHG